MAGWDDTGSHVLVCQNRGSLRRQPESSLWLAKVYALCFFPSYNLRGSLRSFSCPCRTWTSHEQVECCYICVFIIFPMVWVPCWVLESEWSSICVWKPNQWYAEAVPHKLGRDDSLQILYLLIVIPICNLFFIDWVGLSDLILMRQRWWCVTQ